MGKYRPPLNARSLGHGLERLPVAVEELPNADDIAVVAGGMRRYALSRYCQLTVGIDDETRRRCKDGYRQQGLVIRSRAVRPQVHAIL